jgi:hypothetical protein
MMKSRACLGRAFAVFIAAISIVAGVARASDVDLDDVALRDDDFGDLKRAGIVFDDRNDRADGVRARVGPGERIAPVPPRKLPEPNAALDSLSGALKAFAATSEADRGDVATVLDAIAVVRGGGEAFPETLCVGQGRLMQMLDAKLRVERAPDKSAAAAAKSALEDVCQQLPAYWAKDGHSPIDPFIAAAASNAPLPDITLCNVDLVVVVPGLPGDADRFPIEGYMLNGQTAVLEEGQRLGAMGCKRRFTQGQVFTSTEFRVYITLSYRGKAVGFYVTPDHELGRVLPDDLMFVADQIGSTPGTLTWQSIRRDCVSIDCTETKLGPERTVPLKVVSRGYMCEVTYKYNQFAINDRNDVNPAYEWYSSKAATLRGIGVGDNPVFKAYARVPVASGSGNDEVSSWPTWRPIQGSARFAVHAEDGPISIYDHTHTRPQIIAQMGTTELSALRFPRVESTGSATGIPRKRSYSCRPPSIQRDFVAFCTANGDLEPTDSKYLLPFHGKSQVYAGNDAWGVFGNPHTTEGERYAWDFATAFDMDDIHMYAARSGVVINVTQNYDGHKGTLAGCHKDDPNNPGKMIDSDCRNNRTVVLHQDGTTATYQHGEHHGAAVSVGDIVKRGHNLGRSGCVGNCGERHIHFDVHESKLIENQLHNLRVPRVEEEMPTGARSLSIPATFDRVSDVCSVPATGAIPNSTLSDYALTDEGGPVYTTHINNEYHLPGKRRINQYVPQKLVMLTDGPIHSEVDPATQLMHLKVVEQIPAPLTVTFTHDGTPKTVTSNSHYVSYGLSFPAPHGWSEHPLHVSVVDANGHTYETSLVVKVFRCVQNQTQVECN